MNRLLIAVMFLSCNVLAQDEVVETNWTNDLFFQASVSSRIHQLEFWDSSLSNYLLFKPNVAYIFQAELFYKEHSLTLATDNLSDIGVDDEKGSSSYVDTQYSGFFDKDEYRVYYSRYQGFYVSGQRNLSGDYFIFDEINTKRYGLVFNKYKSEPKMISINNQYSNKYTELPDIFGTVTYGLMFDVSYVSNIPSDPAILSQIGNSQFLFFNNLKLVTLSPVGGLLGRFSMNGYFVEAGLSLGIGAQYQSFDLDGVEKNRIDTTLVGTAFISIGKWMPGYGVIGASFNFESVEPSIEGNEFVIATVDANIFYKVDF